MKNINKGISLNDSFSRVGSYLRHLVGRLTTSQWAGDITTVL